LTVLNNVPLENGGSANLILDPTCLKKYERGTLSGEDLHLVQGYYCCEHVLYCPYTCGDKNFFRRATRPNPGTPLDSKPCPFHDGGLAIIDQAI
jgi:hypothetical protein